MSTMMHFTNKQNLNSKQLFILSHVKKINLKKKPGGFNLLHCSLIQDLHFCYFLQSLEYGVFESKFCTLI